jgi:hypothetical protein
MTEHPDPKTERDFEAKLRRQLSAGVRPFDADAIVRKAVAGRRGPGRSALFVTGTALGAVTLTLVTLQIVGGLGRQAGEAATQSPSAQPPSGQPSPTSVATASCSAMPTPAASAGEAGAIDPTGILMVAVGEQVQAGPACEVVLEEFDQVLRLAMNHADDFGYPWLDPATNELVFSVATSEGRTLAEDAAATVTVRYRIRTVNHSYAELRQIQDDVSYLHSNGVANAELIYATMPDQRDNRTLIVMSELSRALLEELARRFPPDAIAVQVNPNPAPAGY